MFNYIHVDNTIISNELINQQEVKLLEILAKKMLIKFIAVTAGRSYSEVNQMMGHLPTKSIEKMAFVMRGVKTHEIQG